MIIKSIVLTFATLRADSRNTVKVSLRYAAASISAHRVPAAAASVGVHTPNKMVNMDIKIMKAIGTT